MRRLVFATVAHPMAAILGLSLLASDEPVVSGEKADGYKGIWFTLGQFSEYGDKYSGGLGTYTAKHIPMAVYAKEAHRTFFVYGGTRNPEERYLLAMASFYDHETGTVPRPTIVHDKEGVDDPHDNPSLAIDGEGRVWVFVSGRGRRRPGFVYRSVHSYGVDAFERIRETEMTYPQPWYVADRGLLLCFTKYTRGRELYWSSSADGREWAEDRKLAGMGGHYQVSRERDGRVITAFNYHPDGNVDRRTNLYYLETDDLGRTWRTASGRVVETPLEDVLNPALVHDFEGEGRLIYVKDIDLDRRGRPVILVVSSGGHEPGPQNDPRTWLIAHWEGEGWKFREVTNSTHNYDMGSLYIEEDGVWLVIAPTEPGPRRWGTGGEMALWLSRDEGVNWEKARDVTRNSERNHAYARRPVNAHPDFYAFWADGDPDEFSRSYLYFTNREGDPVWVLPYEMTEDTAEPARLPRGTDSP